MKSLAGNPVFLLLATGLALGLNFPLGKLASAAGYSPFLWAAMMALVPGLVLAIPAAMRNGAWRARGLWPFALLSGLCAYVIPNAITFMAIPHIGSGLTGLMFALSPVATAIFSLAFRVRPPSRALMVAVGFGLAGAILIIAGRQSLSLPAAANWLLLALVIPVSLATGNVYRTACWPAGATPTELAAASNLLAAPVLLAVAFYSGGLDLQPFAAAPGLALVQCLVSTAMFSLFFRLQWVGGPTYLSQIGYVAAAVSFAIGVAIMQEHYPPLVWAGAGLVLAGIVSATFEKRQRSAR